MKVPLISFAYELPQNVARCHSPLIPRIIVGHIGWFSCENGASLDNHGGASIGVIAT